MTSKIVVNNIEADAGVSTVTFNSNVERGTSNLHSVGLEAAGINVLGADTPIGTGATIYNDGGARFSGIVTATSFVGDGSGLTGAGPTLTNGADNRVVTATGAAALNAESGFTFDGTDVQVPDKIIYNTNGTYLKENQLQFKPSGTAYLDHGTTGQDIQIRMSTSSSLDTTGPTFKSNGNLAFAVGKGIDFSANSSASGMTSELLDGYEEGTWTPTAGGFTMGSVTSAAYTRIGRLVFVSCYINTAAGSSGAPLYIGGLPHVVKSGNYYQYACGRIGSASFTNSANDIVFQFTTGNTTVYPRVQDGGMNWGMASNTHIIFSGCYMS